MVRQNLQFAKPVTLVGGGSLSPERLDVATALAPEIVAADGAVDRLADMGRTARAVIGDMDSIADAEAWRDGPTVFVSLAEQDTTDFEKCLYATEAPFYIGVGFTGRRVDHTLAAFHVMLARPEKRIVLLGEEDAIALMPPGNVLRLELEAGARVSLFPLVPVRGVRSRGLRWPIDGLSFEAGRQVGTSNVADDAVVEIEVDGPGMLVMVEPRHLRPLLDAVGFPG